ncbi:hypothetical protein ANCDUO_24012 [Ancylostoma duodenale]|uniref:Uncharacterized protein n=1 Tax=Ancylostoma duodenale TaxID=51022 RepID=A0A0C2BQ84_9BILA|nr:hypothetical protein ANCDUO_24012 [Ancylostoma duodenale]
MPPDLKEASPKSSDRVNFLTGICNRAPTPALRIICQQITNWDANTRNVRPTTRTSVLAPGPAGLAVGAFTVSAVASSTSPTTAYECMDIACLCGFFGVCKIITLITLTPVDLRM